MDVKDAYGKVFETYEGDMMARAMWFSGGPMDTGEPYCEPNGRIGYFGRHC